MALNHPNSVHRRWKASCASKGTPSAAQVKRLKTAQQTSQQLALALEQIEQQEAHIAELEAASHTASAEERKPMFDANDLLKRIEQQQAQELEMQERMVLGGAPESCWQLLRLWLNCPNVLHLLPSDRHRPPACHLLLRGNRWMPVRVNKTLGANDRCSPRGAVISAFLLAVIEGDMIIGWMKNSAFSVQQPQSDGTLTPLDLTAAGLASQADSADMKANKAGIFGVSSLIAARRIGEQNTGHLPSRLREAAFERATVQILDKLQGHSVVGVRLYDC